MMITLFMIALQIHFISNGFLCLELLHLFTQIRLIKFNFDLLKTFKHLCHVVKNDALSIAYVHHSVNNLIDDILSCLIVTEVWSNRASSEFLDENVD